MSTFRWFDEHAHDSANGGYYETLTRDGRRVGIDQLDSPAPPMFMPNAFPAAYKSMNSHIHLLESLTELYRASKDPIVGKRLEEMLHVVRDKIVVEPGCMNLFFRPDWRPVPDYDSFGHDIETAFLMTEAAEALGRSNDEKTWRVARMIVDHALAFGFDNQNGGFYDKGSALETAYDLKKTWWVQFEGLNALLLMHERYGRETPKYWDAFLKTWRFIVDRMADKEFGGFYMEVERDGTVKNHSKASQWKAAYHDGRALLTTADRLRHLAQSSKS
jgi:mannobiose 2-epimerase